MNPHGQFLETAPYSERDIRPPESLDTHDEAGEFEVRVKARGYVARYIYRHHPLDVVGWDGYLWPYAFNIEDFELQHLSPERGGTLSVLVSGEEEAARAAALLEAQGYSVIVSPAFEDE